jgi:uncharacterized protein (DUF488 family)
MMQNPITIYKLVTIGAYGFDAGTFFDALQEQQVDTFIDIRRRRGVRGAQYAFANSLRLQAGLADRGIRYYYAQDLAPTAAVRVLQHQADTAGRTAKRARESLSPNFIAAYETEILADFSTADFINQLPDDERVIALFCVEKDATACHRSLVAQRLHTELGLPVVNVLPPAPVGNL